MYLLQNYYENITFGLNVLLILKNERNLKYNKYIKYYIERDGYANINSIKEEMKENANKIL